MFYGKDGLFLQGTLGNGLRSNVYPTDWHACISNCDRLSKYLIRNKLARTFGKQRYVEFLA